MTNIKKHACKLEKPSDDEDNLFPSQVGISMDKSRNLGSSCPKPRGDYDTLKRAKVNEIDLKDCDKSRTYRNKIDKFRDTFKCRSRFESPVRDKSRKTKCSRKRACGKEEKTSRRRSSGERKNVRRVPDKLKKRKVALTVKEEGDLNKSSNSVSQMTIDEKELDTEDYERRRQIRKIMDREAAYAEHLCYWTAREKRKAKEYENEKLKAAERRKEESKEARKLEYFFKDYDDERDDSKYFEGSSLTRRLKERQEEIVEDIFDLQKERREELEEFRKLIEEGHNLICARLVASLVTLCQFLN